MYSRLPIPVTVARLLAMLEPPPPGVYPDIKALIRVTNLHAEICHILRLLSGGEEWDRAEAGLGVRVRVMDMGMVIVQREASSRSRHQGQRHHRGQGNPREIVPEMALEMSGRGGGLGGFHWGFRQRHCWRCRNGWIFHQRHQR